LIISGALDYELQSQAQQLRCYIKEARLDSLLQASIPEIELVLRLPSRLMRELPHQGLRVQVFNQQWVAAFFSVRMVCEFTTRDYDFRAYARTIAMFERKCPVPAKRG
jgi:hypothetical protein